MLVVALDFETHRIGPGALAPRAVCCSFAQRDADGAMLSMLLGNHPDDGLEQALRDVLEDSDCTIVTHNGGFDWAVAMASYPALIPLIFDALEAGRCTDTLWREKLLDLSTTGDMEYMQLPDGSRAKRSYSLAALQAIYGGPDRTAEKEDLEESWRANFAALDGWRADDYSAEARQYALDDAVGTLEVYEAQERRKADWHMASTQTEGFRLAASVCLYLMTAWGMEVDPEYVAHMRRAVDAKMAEVEPVLVRAGLLTPAMPAEPYEAQKARAIELLSEHAPGTTWEESRELLESHGIKFKAAKAAKRNMSALYDHVEALYRQLGEIMPETDGGTTGVKKPKTDAEVQEYLADHCPIMAAYRDREALSKIRTNQLPVLESGPVVHPAYDALKETGRTSSYDGGSGKKKSDPRLYPSTNIQNVPKQIEDLDPRRGYRPRDRRVFFDVDFTNLELACVGQITYDLFGESVHRDRYNAGYDLHAYLGSSMAVDLAVDGAGAEFVQECRSRGILADREAVYRAFLDCKKHTEEPVRGFFTHYRTFAKPVGLGFPGGLGPAKMVTFARQTYSVTMTEEQARNFREVWRATYPEMPRFFDWLTSQVDQHNTGEGGESLYWYETILGMIRRGASFCAAANGKSMQSPGAEAAEAGMMLVSRECYDPTLGSVLFGCRPVAFVHDQILGETTTDESLWHDQCMRATELMIRGAEMILRDIKMRSDEAHLTTRWSKKSEPTLGPDGRLIPWRPEA